MIETAYILALGVAILTGVSSLFTKKSLVSLHAAQFVAGRSIFDLLMVIILAPFLAHWPGWTALGLIFTVTVVGGTAGLLVTKGIRHKNMGEIFPLFNFSPIFLVILAIIFLDEKITSMQYIGIAAIMIGAYFLQASKHDIWKPFKVIKNKYVIFVIISMILYSVTATFEKSFLGDDAILPIGIEPLVYLWWIKLFLSLLFFTYDAIAYDIKEIKNVVKNNWKDLGAVSGIGWVGVGMLYTAIPLLNISVLIPIKRSSTLFATILGGKLFHEGHYGQRIIACAVMLAGVILMVL